jgi:hypothetical protein
MMTAPEVETSETDRKSDELDREIVELRDSIKSTRTHGILYYLLLVTIFLVGFALGYATDVLVGAGIIIAGLALVAWREFTSFRARTAVLTHVLGEKLSEKRRAEERLKEFEAEQ